MDEKREMEERLMAEYQNAHLGYLQASPRPRLVVLGKPLLRERVDEGALIVARQRLESARESLRKFWAAN